MRNSRSSMRDNIRRYRERMRAKGLRQIRLWVPDTRSTAFAAECRRQSLIIAGDAAEQVIMDKLDALQEHRRLASMRRGDLAAAALPGEFGKPRPALIIQPDLFNETHPTLTVLPLTSDLRSAPQFRITIEPLPTNGLRRISQVMVDEPMTFRGDKVRAPFGCMDDETMLRVGRALAVWVGIA